MLTFESHCPFIVCNNKCMEYEAVVCCPLAWTHPCMCVYVCVCELNRRKDPKEQYSLFGEVSPDILRLPLYQDEDIAMRRVPRKCLESSPAPMEMDPLFDMDVLMSEFSDTLFSTLASHQHIAWPNPREIAHAGNADMIQPGLIPLQPNLGFMETFDPLQDLFHSLRQPTYLSAPPTASVPSLPSSISPSQAQLLSSMQLPSDHMPSANTLLLPSSIASQTSVPNRDDTTTDFEPNYLPLYSEHVLASSQPISSMALPLTHDLSSSAPPPPPSLDGTILSEAHAAPPTVSAHIRAPGSDYGSVSTQQVSPQLPALAPMPSPPVAQTFALPQPYHPVSANKSRHVKRIAPANSLPTQHLILTGPFSSHANAVIVTPTHLKAEVVPNTGMVIASSPLAGSPGFNVVSQTPTSSQAIVPNDNCFSSGHKSSKASSSAVHSQLGSPCGLDQVPSPQSSISSSGSPLVKNEQNQSRRSTHISAEQKRRCNINNGFKTLCGLVPTLKSQSNISNAVTLQKTVDHIGKLQQERQQMQEEVRRLKEEIEELNASISLCQEQLPATGVPVTRHRYDHMQEKFNEYVKMRTLQNWKFWVFSIIIKPLFESFNGMVLTTSQTELCQTTLQWLDRHCSLPALRPMVLSTLRHLCTSTSILNEPTLLPDEAIQAVSQTDS